MALEQERMTAEVLPGFVAQCIEAGNLNEALKYAEELRRVLLLLTDTSSQRNALRAASRR